MKQEFDGTSLVCHFAEDEARHASARPRDRQHADDRGRPASAQQGVVGSDADAANDNAARRGHGQTD
jgi:hypothetical protein